MDRSQRAATRAALNPDTWTLLGDASASDPEGGALRFALRSLRDERREFGEAERTHKEDEDARPDDMLEAPIFISPVAT